MRKTVLIVIACLGLITLLVLDQWQVTHFRSNKTVELKATLRLCQTRLKNSIASRLDTLKALSALFVLNPETKPDEFAHLASQLMDFTPPIRALQYADSETRVKYVYPPKGNEVTVNDPMLLLSDPKRRPFVRRAILQKKAILQGPFRLRQGGMGIVVRQPIYKGERFLGLSIGVYDLSVLIAEAFEGIELGRLAFHLSDASGDRFWGDGTILNGGQLVSVPVADTQWTIRANWRTNPNPPILSRLLVWLCGTGFILSIIKTIGLLQSQQQRLKETVAKRTAELSKSNATLIKEVTERKQTEKALKQTQERLNGFLNNCPVGLGIWDRDFRYVFINDVLQHMNGPTKEEHMGRTVQEMLPKAAPVIVPLFENIFSSGKPALNMALSGELPSSPGEITHYLVSYFPISTVGKTPDLIGGIITDITDRKRAEEALRISNKRYQKLFHDSPVPLWEEDFTAVYEHIHALQQRDVGDLRAYLDRHPSELQILAQKVKILNVNQATLRLHKAESQDDLIGNLNKIFTVNSFTVFKEEIIALAQGHLSFEAEGEVQTLAGDPRQVFMKLSIDKEQPGAIKALLGTVDITLRKLAEKERDKLQSQLHQMQRLESIGNLAGGIAHDFNNILSAILGFTELSLEEVEIDSTLEQSLTEVFSAGKRAKELVNQILAFARQSDERLKPTNVGKVAEEAIKLLRSFIPSTIEIDWKIETDSLIMGNAAQIHQIFMNLCTNAAQAMEDCGGTLNVNVVGVSIEKDPPHPISAMAPGDYVRITISDTGVGISPEIIDNIFEPYFTTKSVGEGSGMGLAVVHGIIESYGGKIFVESEVGQGAVFHIHLPVTKSQRPDRPVEPGRLPRGNEKILYIDDEAAILKLGRKLLQGLGYEVTIAASGIEALALFQSEPDRFDLVITDMTMPKMTGDVLAAELMAIRPDLPVILCTGYSKKISETRASQIGISAFLYKPMAKADLAQTVRNVLDGQSQSGLGFAQK